MHGKFKAAHRDPAFSEVSDVQWSDWNWQIREKRNGSTPVTPYYAGLIETDDAAGPIRKLVASGFFGSTDSRGDLLAESDTEITKRIETAAKESDRIIVDSDILALLPSRITPALVAILKKIDQVFVYAHFSHPAECTREAYEACARLADAGIILNNKMTLLRGINDDPVVVKELNHRLLMMRVRPYSIFNRDVTKLKGELSVSESRGVEIIEALRGWTSGLAVPHYVVRDESGDHMKIPNYIKRLDGGVYIFRNYKNNEYRYQDS